MGIRETVLDGEPALAVDTEEEFVAFIDECCFRFHGSNSSKLLNLLSLSTLNWSTVAFVEQRAAGEILPTELEET